MTENCVLRYRKLFLVHFLVSKKLETAYRTLQVLEILQNEVLCSYISWGLLPMVIFTHAVSTAVLVSFRDNSHILRWVLGLAALESIFGQILLLGIFASLYVKSCGVISHGTKVLANLSNPVNLGAKRARKFLKSCSNFKVKIGSINFVDQLTPLNSLDFGNCLAVQLILLAGNT